MRKAFTITLCCLLIACSGSPFGIGDFRNATWGMSPAECFNNEESKDGIVHNEPDKQTYKTTMFDVPSNIIYFFENKQLARGCVVVSAKDNEHAKLIFNEIYTGFKNKYANSVELENSIISPVGYKFKSIRTDITLQIFTGADGYYVVADYTPNSEGTSDHESSGRHRKDAEKF